MGIQDQDMFEKIRDELNLRPRVVEGRGEFMLSVSGSVLKNARFKEIMHREPGPYGYYFFWFQTAARRQAYRDELTQIVADQCAPDVVIFEEKQGVEFMTQPKIFATLNYKGKEYEVTDTFTYGYDPDSAVYYWAEGNFSCDCNRRNWLNRQHPGSVPAEEIEDSLGGVCGDTIECTKFRVELID